MAKVGIFFADGCEEIEGLAVVDICRRAGLEIETISIMGRDIVAGSHRIKFQTDAVFEDVDFDTLDGVILLLLRHSVRHRLQPPVFSALQIPG